MPTKNPVLKNEATSVSAMTTEITQEMLHEDLKYLRAANLCIVIDHGRAGNMFFMRLFDQHPEVLVIARMGYFYTSLLRLFKGQRMINGTEAYQWLVYKSNFDSVAAEMTQEIEANCRSRGEDPEATIDRVVVGQVLKLLLIQKDQVTRRDVFYAMHLAYAKGMKLDLRKYKYIFLNDVEATQKYGREAIEVLNADFSKIKVIHLVRDPRANFASLRHQYVNSYGTMYPLKPRRIWEATLSNSVWLWILQYTTQAARKLHDLRMQFDPRDFRIVKIEDVNREFVKTMGELTDWLGVCWYDPWSDPQYTLTSMGRPWRGISAYKSYYQTNTTGPLSNEEDEKVPRFARPNIQVTENWKNHIKNREIKFLEAVYFEEMQDLKYGSQFVKSSADKAKGIFWSILPFAGEFPRWKWFIAVRKERALKDIVTKATYLPVLLVSYFFSRFRMLQMFLSGQLRARP